MERTMKKLTIITTFIFLLTTKLTFAALIDLNNVGYVQYGDAQSYSLPIAQIQDSCTTPGCPYRVASTPGQIQDLVVIATGSNGNPVNTNFTGMDNAYNTPTGVNGSNFFSTGTFADPTAEPDFLGDADDTWDSSLSALMNFLNGDDMVFMFNNNNLNGANLQSLAAWMQVSLTNDVGDLVSVYDLTNDNSAYNLVSEGGGGNFLGDVTTYTSNGSGPDGNINSDTDYVLSGGPICINTDGIVPIPVPCDGSGLPVSQGPINHNLGADEVAYAVLFPELNDQLAMLFSDLSLSELDEYTLHIDLRLGCDPSLFLATADEELCSGEVSGFGKNINNGFEQLFIGTASSDRVPNPIPIPATIFLLIPTCLMLFRHKSYQ
jgi:hypothetical protein